MVAEQVIDAAITSLQRYLGEQVSDIEHISREWPNPSFNLDTPAVSLITGQHQVTLARNYEMAREDIIAGSKAKILWLLGYVNFAVQLDIWTESKEERLDLASQITNALNPDLGLTSGLTLNMDDHYNSPCRYEIDTTAIDDDQDSAQRSEWRFRIELRCHTDMLVQRTEDLARYIEVFKDVSEVQSIVGEKWQPLEINITPRGRAGCIVVPDTASIQTLNFPAPIGPSHYSIRANLINLVDADPQIFQTIVTKKDSESFDVKWPGDLDSANYKVDYNLSTIENPHPSIRSRVASIPIGASILQANFADIAGPLDTTDYVIAAMISNVVDADPIIFPLIAIEKANSFFRIKWPGITDSNFYKLDFIVRDNAGPPALDQRDWRSATIDLAAGIKEVSVVFDEPFQDDDYSITAMLFNSVDADPIISPVIPTAKSKLGATFKWSGPTDSADYKMDYLAIQKEGVDT